MTSTKNMPKDLQAMSNILQDFGITDYENGVENHMLDFTNRYVTTVIEDALLYSAHANKNCIDKDDVELAIQLQHDKIYVQLPTRELTSNMARQRNSLLLPTIRSSAGLRLPPDRHSLTACNYHLKSTTKKLRTVHAIPRGNVSNIVSTTSIAPRSTQKTVQTSLIKFSEANKGTTPTTALSPMSSTPTVSSANSSVPSQILMPSVGMFNEVKLSNDINPNNKRTHDEDDDYEN